MAFAPLALCLIVTSLSIGIFHNMPKMTLWIMAVFFLLGFALFAKAKFSIIKQGRLFTFGPSQMSRSNRIAYFLGYGGMTLGLLLLIGFGSTIQ